MTSIRADLTWLRIGPGRRMSHETNSRATQLLEGRAMGLDLALGGLVLLTAIRGWLKGFLVQAIRLTGLVSSVYLAAPVRDQVKPYLAGYLPTMRPEVLDRLMWWGSLVVSYFVLT